MSPPSPPPSPTISDNDTNPEKLQSDPPPPTRTPIFPSREDCWSDESTRTLIEAWGSHYLQLNRGNLRQNHWQSVADAVNAAAATPNLRRTDVQCKNRLDTVKKKYKIEKSKIAQSNGRHTSTWPHFRSLDSLIGPSFSKSNPNPQIRTLRRKTSNSVSKSPDTSPERSPSPPPGYRRKIISPVRNLPMVTWSVPVGPRSKRSVTERNFSVMAAAAAAMEAELEEEEEEEEEEDFGRKRKQRSAVGVGKGYRILAEAIAKLGEIYVKVEEAKQRQMVELEKQRMQFAKDLEIQRMKVFMESQVQLEKIKQAKRDSENNGYV